MLVLEILRTEEVVVYNKWFVPKFTSSQKHRWPLELILHSIINGFKAKNVYHKQGHQNTPQIDSFFSDFYQFFGLLIHLSRCDYIHPTNPSWLCDQQKHLEMKFLMYKGGTWS